MTQLPHSWRLRTNFLLAIALLTIPVSTHARPALDSPAEMAIAPPQLTATSQDLAATQPNLDRLLLVDIDKFDPQNLSNFGIEFQKPDRNIATTTPNLDRFLLVDIDKFNPNDPSNFSVDLQAASYSLAATKTDLDRLLLVAFDRFNPNDPRNFVSNEQPELPIATPLSKPKVATNILPTIAALNLVLKLKERKVYVYKNGEIIATYPVAVGRKGRETPTGEWYIMETIVNPGWTNFNTGKIVPPGPNNPMGTRWLGFWTDGADTIGFHGTRQVSSIGKAVSSGCVRMLNKDVEQLYAFVKVGTIVTVVND
jgi:L,D-transpeptidase ErfK/SrfK